MDSRKVNREELGRFGLAQLALIEPKDDTIDRWRAWVENYQFDADRSEDDYSWLTCALALKAINSGNFGVGSVLVAP